MTPTFHRIARLTDSSMWFATELLRDPPYITPPIKLLLRKRNKLLRQGTVDSPITKQVGKVIAGCLNYLVKLQTVTRNNWYAYAKLVLPCLRLYLTPLGLQLQLKI